MRILVNLFVAVELFGMQITDTEFLQLPVNSDSLRTGSKSLGGERENNGQVARLKKTSSNTVCFLTYLYFPGNNGIMAMY